MVPAVASRRCAELEAQTIECTCCGERVPEHTTYLCEDGDCCATCHDILERRSAETRQAIRQAQRRRELEEGDAGSARAEPAWRAALFIVLVVLFVLISGVPHALWLQLGR